MSFTDDDAFIDRLDRIERPVANNPSPASASAVQTPERHKSLHFDI
jgi:hypothetical protein